ncbi:hypothetical protein [Alkalicoccobacillus plakortidis]|uniref:Phage-related protein n=1 Tax=Alkalicoccobacillus plakortidis TaxID=444060 RepID=A0ABT0XK51_9BACI|nr:hypothetical protein [Alkalicoccobacillus plakortidis]MCM2675597.1 hypothetical protein [Alkalicoccobacillus plakortidis]
MLKEAMGYLIGLGKAEIHEVEGRKFSDKQLYSLKEPTADAFTIHSLTGFVDYLKTKFDYEETLMIHVVSPEEVIAFSKLNNGASRHEFIRATALTPEFRFDRFYNTEEFNIKMQSVFVQNEDRDIILQVVGNIREDDVKTYGDDGVSQSVVAKTGVSKVADVIVPNPVALKPFRTFVEIEQPVSSFVFRMQNGPSCALFEADGGAWKINAIHRIESYLKENLAKEIDSNKVIVIA